MSVFKFILSRYFWINLILMIVASVVLVLVAIGMMKSYTNHNQYITLSDLSGLTLEQVQDHLEFRNLNYEILDTNHYNPDLLPLSVLKQNPEPNAKVKQGRTIYLWLNASVPPLVEVPDLAGKQSLDMAIIKLENRGLIVGEIIERPSEEKNAVLEVIIAGKTIKGLTHVPKGTVVDLVVGGGIGSTRLRVPCLLGKTLAEVKFTALAYDLNIGLVRYEAAGLTDSASAVVYKQYPACGDGTIRVGEAIDIFLIQDLPDSVVQQINQYRFDAMVEEEILRNQ
jgi:eukaryotic-like serine/threonine-protein kinase